MMIVLYFFLVVFPHAMFYRRLNCIMFVLEHQFVFMTRRLTREGRPVLYNFILFNTVI